MLELGQQFHLHILKKINKAKEIHIKNVLSTRARMCIVLCAICRIKCSILVLDPFTRLWVIWKASHQRRFWIGTEKQKYKLACPHICIMKGNVLNRKIYTLLNYQKHTRIVWTLYLSGSQFWNLLSFFWIFKIYYWKSFFTLHLLEENDATLWGQLSFLWILVFMFSSNNYRQLLGKTSSFSTFSYNLYFHIFQSKCVRF